MKAKYSVDHDNRLVSADNTEVLPIDGTFSVDEGNRLIYWLNEPQPWRVKYQFPEELIFTGNWSLDSNCDLRLKLIQDKSDWQEDILTLKGEIISCESDKLVFELKSIDKNGSTQLRILKLAGTWAADELNQIYFSVSKNEASPDILTLQGAWRLNQNQQIIYTYQKVGLKTKEKILSTLTFSGFWQISSVNQLTYILSTGTNDVNSERSRRIDFKVQIETPNIYPKEGVIKYRLGVGVGKTKPDDFKIISLYGTWKINRKFGLSFEMEYAKGQIQSLDFSAEVNFNKNDEVIFSLKNDSRQDLGISVVFTHRFLKQLDAKFFLRLKQIASESSIDAGIRIPF